MEVISRRSFGGGKPKPPLCCNEKMEKPKKGEKGSCVLRGYQVSECVSSCSSSFSLQYSWSEIFNLFPKYPSGLNAEYAFKEVR